MKVAFPHLVRISLVAILAIGGQVSVCNLVSVVGIDAHHHACSHDHDHPHHHGDDHSHSTDLCFESASETHDNERVPCPESCEVELADTLLPENFQTPPCPVVELILEWAAAPGALLTEPLVDRSTAVGKPPGPDPWDDRVFTGRFLV